MSWQKKDSNKNDKKGGANKQSGKVTANDESPPFDISGRMPPGKVVTEGKDNDGSKKSK